MAASLLAYFIPSPFVGGLMVGTISVATFAMLAVMVMLVTGTAYRSMGATAEVWTAKELRSLRRDGWRFANHVALGKSDIDHVLIGPGGVVAVETKWSASTWVLDPPEPKLRDAVEQVQRNAKNLKYWHDFKSAGPTDVESVLFLWGYDDTPRTRPSRPIVIEGTTVVAGIGAADMWRAHLKATTGSTTAAKADDYWRAIDAQIRTVHHRCHHRHGRPRHPGAPHPPDTNHRPRLAHRTRRLSHRIGRPRSRLPPVAATPSISPRLRSECRRPAESFAAVAD